MSTPSLARTAAEGLKHIKAWVRQHDPEPAHVLHVAKVAGQLFEASRCLHELGDKERILLEAGASLHDIGWTIEGQSHHKHSRDIILEETWPGFDLSEVHLIACIARYHRKAHPKETHKIYGGMTPGDQLLVRQLAALMRIADGLDRSHAACTQVKALHCGSGNQCVLQVRQRYENEIDVWGANRKKELFEEVYGRTLIIEAT